VGSGDFNGFRLDSEDGDGFHLGHKILWIIKKELVGILVDNPQKKNP
jgi:hypothetical protein